VAGDSFTAADISCAYAIGLSRFIGFEERLNQPLRDYAGRLTQRAAYQRAMSKAQPVA
jgi:glutathione S-transferase